MVKRYNGNNHVVGMIKANLGDAFLKIGNPLCVGYYQESLKLIEDPELKKKVR